MIEISYNAIMKIKFATKDDIEKIFELSALNFDWTKEGIEGAFKSKNIILKAEENGRLVGFLIAADLVDSYNLLLVAVKEEQRRKGIASKLIEKLEELAKEKEFDKRLHHTTKCMINDSLLPLFFLSTSSTLTKKMRTIYRVPIIFTSLVVGTMLGKKCLTKYVEKLND